MSSNVLNIFRVGDSEVVSFAASELKRYLELALGGSTKVNMQSRPKYAEAETDALWVGAGSNFKANASYAAFDMPPVDDPEMDDVIFIDVNSGKGIITGINERSVLLAVYRFLTEASFSWVRPGADGEVIPKLSVSQLSANVGEKAAYRHRGICIEGAVSYENVADVIDWAPKVGFNAYFIQFREAYTFFERWYTHRNNPTLKPGEFSVEMARECVRKAAVEIKKRGLIYHAVGHGWTCEPFGIPGLSWDKAEYDIPAGAAVNFAELNGKREIFKGIPLNTNLCYSRPSTRSTVVNAIADYLKEHGEIDVLHFWLADGVNNQCECDNCKGTIPSDYYVMMLNELDEILTREGIKTKVVFLIYVDLLWAPLTQKIKNPDRFILMFAPITRTYSKEFTPDHVVEKLPEYQRNKLQFPSSVDENVGFLKAWQKLFKGDSFDFDYHYMWDHYNDPGYYKMAELLCNDIKHLKNIGLNGFVSCQAQRVFFPTGLGMYVMGRTLWNDKLSFNEMAEEYFRSAFGEDSESCRKYLSKLSEMFDPEYIRDEKPQVSNEAAEKFRNIAPFIKSFMPVIEKNMKLEDKTKAQSWLYLKYHADVCIELAAALEAWAKGDPVTAAKKADSLKELVQKNEPAVQSVLDVWNFVEVLGRRFPADGVSKGII